MTGIDKKKCLGLAAGIVLALIVWNLKLALPSDGQKCLALSLMAVVWWALKAMDSGITAIALLVSFVLFLNPDSVTPSVIFGIWTTPTIYLVIGGFLISGAIQKSGLGERIACYFIKMFVHSYNSVIIACYILGVLLSIMIPHPWPRSFLLMSVMTFVIQASRLSKKYAAQVGLAIFGGSIPTSMILITGDSTLNAAAAGFAETTMSWGQWAFYMGLPGILAAVLTCTAQLLLFKKPKQFELDQMTINEKILGLGKIRKKEVMTILVMVFAIGMWMTDSIHGIHSGWIAIGAVVLLATPIIGVITKESWNSVSISTLLFLTAALSIGAVGKVTGMNQWIAESLMPKSLFPSPYLFALVACAICMVMHLLLGSTLAVLGIAAPAVISFGQALGIPALVSAMIAYTAVCLHWLLPFHHMNLLVGLGEQGGGYTEKEVLKLGLAQTAVVILVCMAEILWWSAIGLL